MGYAEASEETAWFFGAKLCISSASFFIVYRLRTGKLLQYSFWGKDMCRWCKGTAKVQAAAVVTFTTAI